MSWIGDLPELIGEPFEYMGGGICAMCSEEMREFAHDDSDGNVVYWEYVCECGYKIEVDAKEEEEM